MRRPLRPDFPVCSLNGQHRRSVFPPPKGQYAPEFNQPLNKSPHTFKQPSILDAATAPMQKKINCQGPTTSAQQQSPGCRATERSRKYCLLRRCPQAMVTCSSRRQLCHICKHKRHHCFPATSKLQPPPMRDFPLTSNLQPPPTKGYTELVFYRRIIKGIKVPLHPT